MPQLKGPERKELFDLLVEHISLDQLARILSFKDLSELEDLVRSGDRRKQVEVVVDAFSKRYEIIPLVEGCLEELGGSCPPLKSWLDSRRAELIRRQNRPAIVKRIEDSPLTTSLGCLATSASLVVCVIAVLYLSPSILQSWQGPSNYQWQRLPPDSYTTEPAVTHQISQLLKPDMEGEVHSLGFQLNPEGNSFPRQWELAKMWESRYRIGVDWQVPDEKPVVTKTGTSAEFLEHVDRSEYQLFVVFFPLDREALRLIQQKPPDEFLTH